MMLRVLGSILNTQYIPAFAAYPAYPQCKYFMLILNTQYIPASPVYPIPPVQIFHVAHLPEFWTGLDV